MELAYSPTLGWCQRGQLIDIYDRHRSCLGTRGDLFRMLRGVPSSGAEACASACSIRSEERGDRLDPRAAEADVVLLGGTAIRAPGCTARTFGTGLGS